MASLTIIGWSEHTPLSVHLVRSQRDEYPAEVNSLFCLGSNAIKQLGDRLDELTNCPHCNGTGKRFHALHGYDSCVDCKGTGKKR